MSNNHPADMKKQGRATFNDALRACTPFFAWSGFFSLAINLLQLTAPVFTMQIYDRVLSSGSVYTLGMLIIGMLIAYVAMAALEDARTRLLVRSGIAFDKMLSATVLASLIEQSVRQGDAKNGQALRDLDQFRQFMTGPGVNILFDAPWLPLYMVVIFLLHPVLGLAALGGAAVFVAAAIANQYAIRRPMQLTGEAAIKNYLMTDGVTRNADVVQAMGMKPAILSVWTKLRAEMMELQAFASDCNGGFAAFTRFLSMFLNGGMIGLGAWMVIDHDLTLGGMYAATMLMGRAIQPVQQIVALWPSFSTAIEARSRVIEILDAAPSNETKMALPRPKGRITADRLLFVPPGGSRPTIKGISFEIEPGECIGIIGPSAAGKSTLARLMAGAWHATAGTVRIDGADIATWNSDDLGPHVGYLPQDIRLLAGTVAENIARLTEADPEEIYRAANRAGVHEMILGLPNGYETPLGDGGMVLSGGQRQRIGLARALFGSPAILVLDEPNSNLDSDGEQQLAATIAAFKQAGTTIVLVTHRPSALESADRIMVMKDGAIEQFKPRLQVLARVVPTIVRPAPVAANAGGAA